MDQRPWRHELKRARMRRHLHRHRSRVRCGRSALYRNIPAWLFSLLVAVGFAMLVIGMLESRLQPILETTAKTQTKNHITKQLEQAISADLVSRETGYGDFVIIDRDELGRITAVRTDMAELNLLRGELVSVLLAALDDIDTKELAIPLGSLVDSELLWARGPAIHVRAIQVGSVSAEFQSEFLEAGVNQTKHRVWLAWSVPVTVLLPGRTLEVPIQTELCVAETVIVGQVPDTYLGLAQK